MTICRKARRFLYFEDQYLIGTPELSVALRDKLASNAELVIIGIMAPLAVVGDLPWLKERRTDFWLPLVTAHPDQVLLFEMLAPDGTDMGPGAYLHNKMTIADDLVVTAGSVNFSRRSHTHDSEIMVTFGGPATPSADRTIGLDVRARRWARHLGTRPNFAAGIGDAIAAMRRPPSTARIRRWTPVPYSMSFPQRQMYLRSYDVVWDPA